MTAKLPKIRQIAPRFPVGRPESELTLRARKAEPGGPMTNFVEPTLPIAGQGVASLTIDTDKPFRIILTPTRDSIAGQVIVLEVTASAAIFRDADDERPESVLARFDGSGMGLDAGVRMPYWLSLDSQNRRLRYGKGYAQVQLMLAQWDYPAAEGDGDPADLPFAWTEQLRYVAIKAETSAAAAADVQVLPMPVVCMVPPVVVSDQAIDMEDLALGNVTVAQNLSEGCQLLHANVAGANIRLDTPDFPNFSDAINYSIVTPGCVCYELLKAKETEFGDTPNPKGTYLRITLGDNLGDSPGVPFVLEIWPGGNYSPIHNHAGTDAVIKVLHGQIRSQWFAALSPTLTSYYEEFDLHAGEVTWLSPDYYQTHRLCNPAPEGHMCATLQCYRYPNSDRKHYEYFDYLEEGTGEIKQFYPNSDMDFLEFKRRIKDEWEASVAPQGYPDAR